MIVANYIRIPGSMYSKAVGKQIKIFEDYIEKSKLKSIGYYIDKSKNLVSPFGRSAFNRMVASLEKVDDIDKAILVITPGAITHNTLEFKNVINNLNAKNIKVYSIISDSELTYGIHFDKIKTSLELVTSKYIKDLKNIDKKAW